MTFEKQASSNSAEIASWPACTNCSYKKEDTILSSEYHNRSSETASARNAELNGKSCVSS